MKCDGKTFFKKLEYNVWCYEQVCLAEIVKLQTNFMANLHIARVSNSTVITDKLNMKHKCFFSLIFRVGFKIILFDL
jgi:hypothetical protein